MNLIEMLLVLAAVNSAAPLDAGPHTRVTQSQVVRERCVRCACLPANQFDATVVTRNSTDSESAAAHVCAMLKGVDLHRLERGQGKTIVVYRGR